MSKAENSNKLTINKVKVIRDELGLTQERFAEMLGYSSNYISMIETGSKPLSHKLAKKIADIAAYPARVDWIMGISEQRTENELLIHKMEKKDHSFRSTWTLLDDALNLHGMRLAFYPDSSSPFDNDMPLHVLFAFGDFVIEDLDTQAHIKKLPKGVMQALQKRLVKQAELLADELLEEGDTEDGEQ